MRRNGGRHHRRADLGVVISVSITGTVYAASNSVKQVLQLMSMPHVPSGWLLLLVQLPTSPSSSRVALWRRLRAAGAARMLNGAWMLPHSEARAEFLRQVLDTARGHGGTGFVLTVCASPEVDEAVIERFRDDRGREYDEFEERCAAFLDEIGKESGAGKFTFAELEESEQDLAKLVRWHRKIQTRDFFPDRRGSRSAEMMERCRRMLHDFAEQVYQAEGVHVPVQPAGEGQDGVG